MQQSYSVMYVLRPKNACNNIQKIHENENFMHENEIFSTLYNKRRKNAKQNAMRK